MWDPIVLWDGVMIIPRICARTGSFDLYRGRRHQSCGSRRSRIHGTSRSGHRSRDCISDSFESSFRSHRGGGRHRRHRRHRHGRHSGHRHGGQGRGAGTQTEGGATQSRGKGRRAGSKTRGRHDRRGGARTRVPIPRPIRKEQERQDRDQHNKCNRQRTQSHSCQEYFSLTLWCSVSYPTGHLLLFIILSTKMTV